MKRLALRTENQWRSLRDGAAVDVFRLTFHANRWLFSAALTVAGFGVGLMLWHYTIGREHA